MGIIQDSCNSSPTYFSRWKILEDLFVTIK